MADHIERTKDPVQRAREHLAKGRSKVALKLVEDHLLADPDDADAWYFAAELLMRLGKGEDGFRAMARARELSQRRK